MCVSHTDYLTIYTLGVWRDLIALSRPMAAAANELVVPAAAAPADMLLFVELGSTSGSHPHSISSEG